MFDLVVEVYRAGKENLEVLVEKDHGGSWDHKDRLVYPVLEEHKQDLVTQLHYITDIQTISVRF